jgi:tetratricopeptide (TPR) repeat protein
MLRDRSAGPSHTSRRSWYIPASIALLLFLNNVAGNVVAARLDSHLKDFTLWVVWIVFGVAMVVTVLTAIRDHRQRKEELATSDDQQAYGHHPPVVSGLAPDQQMRFLTSQTLIGHQIEREHLCRLYDTIAADQRGRIVLLTARPGYGRHALAQTVVTYAQAHGSAVIVTDFRQDAASQQAGLTGHMTVLAQRCPQAHQLAGDGWLTVMGKLVGSLASLPAPPLLTDLPLEDDPAHGLAALVRLVARRQAVAQRPPLLLVWEYLDQAPPLWGDILRYLAPEICLELPVLLVATATAAGPLTTLPVERRSAVLEVAQILSEHQQAEILWLERVTERDIAQYLGAADPLLPQRLHHLADGIPALVESLWHQWQESLPPAVVYRDDRWEVARTDNVWVFGEARDQAEAMVAACLATPAPFDRFQVEEMLTCAALEGLTFTAQVVAQVLGLPADDLMDFWDTFLLTSDVRLGLLADAGFLDLPAVQGTTPSLNRYRFALPYLWHVWVRYCPEAQRIDLQRRVAEALEAVYAYAHDLVSPMLVALFEATGQESRAVPYRRRTQIMASLEALHWQVTMLEALAAGGQDDAQDRYRLFELRVVLSDGLSSEGRWEEGYLHAERAYTMAQTWHDTKREAQALTAMGCILYQGAHFSRAEDTCVQALAICERVLGPEHPRTATCLINLAAVYDAQRRYAEAEPLLQRALAIDERVLGLEHSDTARSLNGLAAVYHAQERYTEAEPLYKQALAIREQRFGPDHPHVAVLLTHYATLLRNMHRDTEAADLESRSAAIRTEHV